MHNIKINNILFLIKTNIFKILRLDDDSPLEVKIYTLIFFIGLFYSVILTGMNIYMGIHDQIPISLICFFFCVFFLYFVVFHKKMFIWLFINFFALTMIILLIKNYGTRGNQDLLFPLIFIISVFITSIKKYQIFLLIYFIGVMFVFIFIEEYFPNIIEEPYGEDIKSMYMDFRLNLFIYFTLTALFVIAIKRSYDKERDQNISQKKKIEQEAQNRNNFFINLAHETRTPLTLISNYLDAYIAKKGEDLEIKVVKKNIEKLQRDMVNFMDAEKLDKGLIIYDHDTISDFSDILKEKIRLFKSIANHKNIVIHDEIENNIFLKVDPYAIDRVINNLIENAIKYTNQGGTISVTLEKKGQQAVFSVKDTGIGIMEEQQQHIFDPYYQITRKKFNRQGIGMGLAIVKNIINGLQGNIKVTSHQETGSEFKVELPVFSEAEAPDIEKCEVSKPLNIASEIMITDTNDKKEEPSVMVVEDNTDMLLFLRDKISEKFNVIVAENGQEALNKLNCMPLPDLIVTDIMMDDMDGYDLLRTLSDNNRFRHIPLIFLTAKSTFEDKIYGLKLGAIDFIHKPFSIEELLSKINSIIENLKNQKHVFMEAISKAVDSQMKTFKPEEKNAYYNFENKCKSYNITNREKDIILLLMKGLGHKEISEKLFIAPRTVTTHVQNIYNKLEVKNKIELVNVFLKYKE